MLSEIDLGYIHHLISHLRQSLHVQKPTIHALRFNQERRNMLCLVTPVTDRFITKSPA